MSTSAIPLVRRGGMASRCVVTKPLTGILHDAGARAGALALTELLCRIVTLPLEHHRPAAAPRGAGTHAARVSRRDGPNGTMPGTDTRWPASGSCKTSWTCRVRNPVFLTGDWHSTFANDLKVDFEESECANGRGRVRDAGDRVGRRRHAVQPVLRADDPVQPAHRVLRGRQAGVLQGDGHAGAHAARSAVHEQRGETFWHGVGHTERTFIVEDGLPGVRASSELHVTARENPPMTKDSGLSRACLAPPLKGTDRFHGLFYYSGNCLACLVCAGGVRATRGSPGMSRWSLTPLW